MTVLVTGATGTVGRHLVHQLVSAGHEVRALTRAPEKADLPPQVQVVAGDLADPASLAGAFDGVTAVHLITFSGNNYAPLTTGPEIVKLAAEAGVRRVTVLWSGYPGPVEDAVRASGLEWTLIQPVEFMSNALGWADSVRTEGVAREVFPYALNAAVHPADIAAVTARALTEDGHNGRSYDLTGPEALNFPQKVALLSAAVGKDIRFVELTEEQARNRMRAKGIADAEIDFVIGWHANPPAEAYTVLPTVEDVTGQPARTYAQWAAENADAFR
ncbi:NAD(P)H-binding protein [Allokutzneria oryzae]|uniref:NAD(P)H-binding protein n=1 Tax=Allokutzneria oryzae TaxID=1378989 RepID=A0ABV6A588_9PSEU